MLVLAWTLGGFLPLAEMLSHHPDFFVARQASRLEVLVWMGGLAFGPAGLLVLFERGLAHASGQAARLFRGLGASLGLASFLASALSSQNLPPEFLVGSSLLGGVLAALLLLQPQL